MADIDDLMEQIDADLDLLFAPIARDIEAELTSAKPNISRIERRVTGKLGTLFGFTAEEAAASPLGIYFRGAITAARALSGEGGGSLETVEFGQSRAERLWETGKHLREMITANLRAFAQAKPGGKITKDSVREFFRTFLTVDGAANKIGLTGDHGLYEVRRHVSFVVREEYGVGLQVAAVRRGANIKWNLHPRHPAVDICDEHAKRDDYGLGPGVYPPGKVPQFPPHPHCLCFFTLT